MKKISKSQIFSFDNTYINLPKNFYQKINPVPVKNPRLLKLNDELLDYFDLDKDSLESNLGVSILSGNKVPTNTTPLAMVYAGHQFGNFVNQLGDGRAVLLGEIIARNGKRYDLQLKGSGKTIFSRQGDGRSPLGPVIREYIISEAMHYLGIPTTRSLSIISTGEVVEREKIEPGGILVRVSPSHIRIGTFEFFSAKKDFISVKKLTDYTIERHFPEVLSSKNHYKSFLEKVITSQAKLIAQWMNIGFIHGVMNTDNTSISGQTIDYGPCAFMNNFNPNTVYSFIDFYGRYSYGNQPKIMLWNLSKFAECISFLINENNEEANKIILESLSKFPQLFDKFWINAISEKLGLSKKMQEDKRLIEKFLEIMFEQKTDFTLTFRTLSESINNDEKKIKFFSLFKNKKSITNWYNDWVKRIEKESFSKGIIKKKMKDRNPFFIPRNHLVEKAIDQAVKKHDFSMVDNLVEVLKKPFESDKNFYLSYPPKPNEDIKNTFCGT
ncbi:MAG: hypothetical protein CMP38_06530 [Rickettsiales bacterium]|nr:hypothetical protein [Rickettsiales bacterium]OUV99614.1 MAG: hypothetical protein CBD16_07880 [Betaproteobacteria bacterium TMED156]